MDVAALVQTLAVLSTPISFAALVGLATVLIWLAFAPAPPAQIVRERLEDYLDRGDVIEATDFSQSFFRRAIVPFFRRLLRFLGRLLPQRNVEATQQLLVRAGSPAGVSALDFLGLRLLLMVVLGGGYFLRMGVSQSLFLAARNSLALALAGYFLPYIWLRLRVNRRQRTILRALPDALDMLTISVEAGLAFESAMLRVGERLDNALTREFRRAVAEMRIGVSRNAALQHMVDRTGVQELGTFVAVLIQSSQLGVSIAEVLHSQAEQMRIKRRQRVEELARQAGVKMVFPLVFFIFPAMFVVILGPGVPQLVEFFRRLTAGG